MSRGHTDILKRPYCSRGGGHTVAYSSGHTVASVDPTGYACAIMKRSTAWQQNTLPTQWRFIEALRIQQMSTLYGRGVFGKSGCEDSPPDPIDVYFVWP